MSNADLTDKREAFCQIRAFQHDVTQHDAYGLAGYSVENMSFDAVRVEATRLEAVPAVSLRIQSLRDAATLAVVEAVVVTQVELEAEYRKMAFGDVKADLNWKDKQHALDQLAARRWPAVKQSETHSVVLLATLEDLEPEKRAELIELLQEMKEKGEEE